ncbi:hypothetical protein GG344DRAFT_74068 [Lentinula edodes]|nr:hypothetical protein GG344DRAFT_74068 [Lentinula edodes]
MSSKETADVEKATSGNNPSPTITARAVASKPVVAYDDDEGEESDTYDDFDQEEYQDGSEDEEEDDEGHGAPPNKSSLTALLLGNSGVTNGIPEVDAEEDEDEDEGEDYHEGDEDEDEDADGTFRAPASTTSTTNGKKRSIGDLREHDDDSEGAQTKKVKA